MGPPLFSDGNLSLCRSSRHSQKMLQWGRHSSATETLSAANQVSSWCAVLQWGRRSSATETVARNAPPTSPVLASMGPPLFSDGNMWQTADVYALFCCFNGAAALQRRKPVAGPADETADVRLQWGRRSSATETRRWIVASKDADELQWGRRSSATETRRMFAHLRPVFVASMGPPLFSDGNVERMSTIDSTMNGFNGAAALQRRKHRTLKSCGCERRRFNGAAALQRRKPQRHSPEPHFPHCFNGAAALQRRKRGSRTNVRLQFLASMGPPLFSDGNAVCLRSGVDRHNASMGPPLFSDGNRGSDRRRKRGC